MCKKKKKKVSDVLEIFQRPISSKKIIIKNGNLESTTFKEDIKGQIPIL